MNFSMLLAHLLGSVSALGGGEGEIVFLFLGEVKCEHCVQAVQACEQVVDAPCVDDLRCVDLRQVRTNSVGQSFDFGVRAAHRRGRLASAERDGQGRVELSFLGPFVREYSLDHRDVRVERLRVDAGGEYAPRRCVVMPKRR